MSDSLSAFKNTLCLSDDEVDEDLCVTITSVVTTAVHDKDPKHDLQKIVEAIKQTDCVSSLEPLTIILIVTSSTRDGADELMDVMARECSAKEVVIAVEESVEVLHQYLLTKNDDNENDGDEDALPRRATPARQLVRLIRSYTSAIPRLPKWRKAPADTVESRLAELESVLPLVNSETTGTEGRDLIQALTNCCSALAAGADEKSKGLLIHLVEEAVVTFASSLDDGLARKAFAAHFPRLVVPGRNSTDDTQHYQDALADTWTTLRELGLSERSLISRPSLSSLILLAHEPTFSFTLPILQTFFPTVIMSIQLNVSLDETLSVLLSTLASLHAASVRSELGTDLVIPLMHLLPQLAGNHPDPDIRHFTFRTISLVLGLAPSPIRFRLLHELLTDEDLPVQMRVATVGLLKEAVLESLSKASDNMFASPLLLATFGPIVLRPEDPSHFNSISLEDFMESAEPLRLVECLGFYYVLLLRDVHNRTGVRDDDSLQNVEHALIQPLHSKLKGWIEDLKSAPELQDHDGAMQLDILSMWEERVQGAIDRIARA